MRESPIRYDQILDYDRVFSVIEKTMSTSSFYWQSLSVIACFIAAYFLYKISFKFISQKISAAASVKTHNTLRRYVLPNLYPALALILLCPAYLIFAQFFHEAIIFQTTVKLIALFLFLSFIRISSNSHVIANIAGLFLVPTLILDIFGAFDLAIEFLDQFAFNFGKIRISLYLLLKASVILLIVIWFANLIKHKSKHYIENNTNIRPSTKTILGKMLDIMIYPIVALVALDVLGVDLKAFAFVGGAVGVGVGLGLQKIASNFISGLVLLLERSIEVGDIVELNNGAIYGTVKRFGGRYTLIETVDGKEIMIPNEEMIVNRVANLTYSNNRGRVEVVVGISYDSDPEKARQIMIEAANQHPRCIKNPTAECYVTEFGAYDIKLLLHFWVENVSDGRFTPRSEVMMQIFKIFKEEGVRIPFPRQDLSILGK
jgi:small-conductance mechanosensitive channel